MSAKKVVSFAVISSSRPDPAPLALRIGSGLLGGRPCAYRASSDVPYRMKVNLFYDSQALFSFNGDSQVVAGRVR